MNEVTRVRFFDLDRDQDGVASNAIEPHAVLSIHPRASASALDPLSL